AFDPISPLDAQRQPRYAIGGEGEISVSPEGSDWVFSAAIRYGRANNSRRAHNESPVNVANVKYEVAPSLYPTPTAQYPVRDIEDVQANNKQSYSILDFQVGKDVGLGFLGRDSSSRLHLGVRFAQFVSRSATDIIARPDVGFTYKYTPFFGGVYLPLAKFHQFHSVADTDHSFHGVGPSVEWEGSIPIVGDSERDMVSVDFGFNGALLFGRQKVTIARHETGYYVKKSTVFSTPHTTSYDYSEPVTRTRSVVVPNVGGFAGVSYRFPNAKVALGYRIDAFFGAMDGGISTQKSFDKTFHGPFAMISIGLGG